MSFWNSIPTKNIIGFRRSINKETYYLLGLLNALFLQHGKKIQVWESGRTDMNLNLRYFSKLEVTPKDKYKD
jgi:hypothetical protein